MRLAGLQVESLLQRNLEVLMSVRGAQYQHPRLAALRSCDGAACRVLGRRILVAVVCDVVVCWRRICKPIHRPCYRLRLINPVLTIFRKRPCPKTSQPEVSGDFVVQSHRVDPTF